MSGKHFHVLTGVRGFQSNVGLVFPSRKEAEQHAIFLAAEARDKGSKVTGTARDGYYIIDAANCIQITTCTKIECSPTHSGDENQRDTSN